MRWFVEDVEGIESMVSELASTPVPAENMTEDRLSAVKSRAVSRPACCAAQGLFIVLTVRGVAPNFQPLDVVAGFSLELAAIFQKLACVSIEWCYAS